MVSVPGIDLDRAPGSRDGAETERRFAGAEVGDVDDVDKRHAHEVRGLASRRSVDEDGDNRGADGARLASRPQPPGSQQLDRHVQIGLVGRNEVIVREDVPHPTPVARAGRGTSDQEGCHHERDRQSDSFYRAIPHQKVLSQRTSLIGRAKQCWIAGCGGGGIGRVPGT